MSKRKGRYRKSAQPLSRVFFTLLAVRLLKDALRVFEKSLLRTKELHPHLPLAKEVVEQLKSKLDAMLQMEDWGKETPFDFNEMHILYAAVQMYLVELTVSHQEHLLPMCVLLCKQFSRVVEELKQVQMKKAPNCHNRYGLLTNPILSRYRPDQLLYQFHGIHTHLLATIL